MTSDLPIVLITSEAKAALEAVAERAGVGGDLVGGLLFGCPLDERRRLVVSSTRVQPEANFGTREFCLDQSRTSEQLAGARDLNPQAGYCGVWYLHRTPTGELTDDEWVQAQGVLEDPDFPFKDLVCLVVCLYGGDLNTYALILTLDHSARGQLPSPTVLRVLADSAVGPAPSSSPAGPPPPSADWYKNPQVARRLNVEHERLASRYRVELAPTPDGQAVFRLMPKGQHEDLVFYMACDSGFPEEVPAAFLTIRGDRYPLLSPALSDWSPEHSLVELADDLIEWQVALLDEQLVAAEAALERGDYEEASDLLAMVLLIDPRKAGAARLLAKVQAIPEATLPDEVAELAAELASPDWYTSPQVSARLNAERELLAERYRVEPGMDAEGKVVFRLMPVGTHEDMVFHIACGPGFPDEPPVAYLSLRGDRYPLFCSALDEWLPDKRLVDVADDLVAEQVSLLDGQLAAAEAALEQGEYQKASDLLVMVLLIDPRKPRAARMLARAQSLLGAE